jgi:predicted membrane metal-binding protein
MRLTDFLNQASRRVKTAFASLTAAGRSEKRAIQLIRQVENAPIEAFLPVPGTKRARYFLSGAPRTAPSISRREYLQRQHGGASLEELAKLRKENAFLYKTSASREQAVKQRATRKLPRKDAENRRKAAASENIKGGRGQERRALNFLEGAIAQHELYLQTGRGKLPPDEYRKAVHLGFVFYGDDERMKRMKLSRAITAEAA